MEGREAPNMELGDNGDVEASSGTYNLGGSQGSHRGDVHANEHIRSDSAQPAQVNDHLRSDRAPPAQVNVPILDTDTLYEVWKEDILRWTSITRVPVSAQALTIHFALRGRAKTASDQLPRGKLNTKEGVSLL